MAPGLWLYLPADIALQDHSARYDLRLVNESNDRSLRKGYVAALAGIVRSGLNVVGEGELSEGWLRSEAAALLSGLRFYIVMVWCDDPNELEKRERDRVTTYPGFAVQALSSWEWDFECDLTLNSAIATPDVLVGRLLDWFRTSPEPRALRHLTR